jgi:endonuclease/exonuclease/phosphatase family metal-dependent hydrolase
MKILTINCQRAYQSEFKDFLLHILGHETYDFILIQESTPLIISIITASGSPYKILNPNDASISGNSGVAILYKEKFNLQDSIFISFARLDPDMPAHGWGFVTGFFNNGEEKYIVASTHLHSGINMLTRKKELKIIKEKIKEYAARDYPVIIGGDFNTGIPGEVSMFDRIFSPEYSRITKGVGPTLDSKYTENSPLLLNRLSTVLAKVSISLTFYTDHLYMNAKMISVTKFTSRALPDRVSDHSPVELVINE